MYQVSPAFHDAFKSDVRNVHVEITVGTTVYTRDDIMQMEYEGLSFVGGSFSIGSAPANSIKVIFHGAIETFKEMEKVKVRLGIDVGASIEWCPLGEFYISERADVDHNEQRTTIECLDGMVFLEGIYTSKLAYPAPIKDVALEIANLSGTAVNTTTFTRLRTEPIKRLDGLTYRQAIGAIAQFEVGFATFDRNGLLDIRKLNNTSYEVTPNEYFLKGLRKNDLKYTLGGISVKVDEETTLTSGQSTGSQIELENSSMTQRLLDSIYLDLKTTNFYPFTLSWRGNPAIEAGDWIQMTDVKGNIFKGPNLNYKLTYNGGLTAESIADTEVQSASSTSYRPPLSQKLEQIGIAIKNAAGNINYYGLDAPFAPKLGDLWFKPNGPEEELWQYVEIDGVQDWKLIISTADIRKVEREVAAAQKEAEEAKLEAQNAYASAVAEADRLVKVQQDQFTAELEAQKLALEKAITDGYNQGIVDAQAKVDALETAINAEIALKEAALAADIAQSKADAISTFKAEVEALKTAHTERMDSIKAETDAIKETADKNSADIDFAITEAGFTTLAESLSGIKGIATTAQQNAQTGIIKADAAMSEANVVLGKVTAVEGKTTTMDTKINTLTGELLLKTNLSEFNALKGTVNTQGTSIEANATAVGLKADKTFVDTINQTVTKHTLDIKAANDGLALKAEKSIVDSIKGTVDTHTNQISANAQAISLRLTSTQVDSLVTGKGYATTTALNATSSSLGLSISEVSTRLDNVKVGGRNLLRDSGRNIISDAYNLVRYDLTETLEEGEELTISLKGNLGAGKSYWGIYNSGGSVTPVSLGSASKENGVYRATFKWRVGTTSNSYINVYHMPAGVVVESEIEWIKLEKGNVATDWTPAPEDMATVERMVSVEANLNGLQATVANKAEQSQVTQLAGQIASKVESATHTASINQLSDRIQSKVESADYATKMSQLDSAINLRATRTEVNASILADKTIKDTRNENQLPSWYFDNYPRQTVEEFKLRVTIGVSGTSSTGQLTTKVPWNDTSGGSITQTFSSADGVFQRMSNGRIDEWLPWDKVAEASKLISQINISPESILIASDKIHLSGNTYMDTAFVNRIKANSLEAVNADIANLKAKILTANSITSTHLESSTATINKLFATDALVNTLTAKTAFISSVQTNALTAVNANIGSLRTSILTSDVINSTHLKVDQAMINKLKVNNLLTNSLVSDTIMTNAMRANALSAVTANITSIRSQILVSNVVEATHLKADTAMVNKLFATTALVDTLTSKLAFINSVKAIEVSADKITTGTLNAANVNLINVNVNNLVGNRSEFVRSAWNGLTSNVEIDSTGLYAIGSGFWRRSYFSATGFDLYNGQGATNKAGVIGYFKADASQVFGDENYMRSGVGSKHSVGIGVNRTANFAVGYQQYTTQPNGYTKAIQINGDDGLLRLYSNITAGNSENYSLQLYAGEHRGSPIIGWNDGGAGRGRVYMGQDTTYIESGTSTEFYARTGSHVLTLREAIIARKNIFMDGYEITGQSDIRLKENVTDVPVNLIAEFKRMRPIEFDWDKDNPVNKSKPSGRQIGLEAQSSPFLQVKQDQESYLSISLSRQATLNSMGIKKIFEILERNGLLNE